MKHFVPQLGGPFEAPFPSDPEPLTLLLDRLRERQAPRSTRSPGRASRIKLSARTEWGSPRIFGVVRRRGEWISVQAPELDNGEVAWIESNRVALDCVHWAIRANLKKRRLYVQHNGSTVRRFTIAVGRPGNQTPQGRFTVTDKLRVTDPGSPYGCCVLALSGHQTHLPPSWPGGDRLAVHATNGAVQPRPGGEPRLHARDLGAGPLADQDDPARHAAVRQGLISHDGARRLVR